MKIGTTSRVLVALLAVSTSAAGAAYLRTEPPAFGGAQVLARLPGGAFIHSLVRANLDGQGPMEVAAVAGIPAFPGGQQLVYVGLIFRYDRFRRRFVEAYRAAVPGRIPFSVDAVGVERGREVVIFSALNDDGTRPVEVLTLAGNTGRRLSEDEVHAVLRDLPPPLPTVTWRYSVRNGTVAARSSEVRLRVRQALRVQPIGGGPSAVVLPDPRLDVTETGFRARTPGRYRIRVVTGLAPPGESYALTLVVEAGSSSGPPAPAYSRGP